MGDVNVEAHQLILGILTAEEEWRPTESGTLTVRFTLEDCLKTPTSTTWRMHSLGTGGSKLCGWLDGLLALDLLRWRTLEMLRMPSGLWMGPGLLGPGSGLK